ncbi:Asp23/Gls24 family envelope stress response protein [Lactobacillus sp. ESL0228]|uniref:Asp23/Gls24 family envelope stress response protein n=1 Tax=Lactobacillus sp. ESL0228 TaxID=2069352 RepID=UPI000EFCF4ED|nr:Asp23/Gls24 family envelope stress response protein [Lactobacillus sp. ESL0228]RMC47390.1 Asp23/Gls24 family envelope stress response protein [Lactobacillus sp. ESL0228]
MTENNSKHEVKGDLNYDSKVIQKIIGIALSDIKGLLTVNGGFFSNLADKIVNTDDVTNGINVEVGKKQVAVDIEIVAEYGVEIAKLYDQIKKKIFDKVKEMTGLDTVEVNVTVVDIKTKEQHEKDSVSLQDKITGTTKDAKEKIGSRVDKVENKIDDKTEDIKKKQMTNRVN